MARTVVGTQSITAATLDTNPGNNGVPLTVPGIAGAVRIYVIEATQGSGNRLFVTEDGTEPLATNGGVLPTGFYDFEGDISRLRFKNETTSGCRLYAVYYDHL